MAIDPQHIGALAMSFIERLEQKYGEDAKIDGLVFLAAATTATRARSSSTPPTGRATRSRRTSPRAWSRSWTPTFERPAWSCTSPRTPTTS